jgi:magnesium-transporting ATPase (P-type)
MRSEIVARVATKLEKNPFVEVLFVAVRLVTNALVVVELPMIASVIVASVATRLAKNPLVVVLFVEKRLFTVPTVVA